MLQSLQKWCFCMPRLSLASAKASCFISLGTSSSSKIKKWLPDSILFSFLLNLCTSSLCLLRLNELLNSLWQMLHDKSRFFYTRMKPDSVLILWILSIWIFKFCSHDSIFSQKWQLYCFGNLTLGTLCVFICCLCAVMLLKSILQIMQG